MKSAEGIKYFKPSLSVKVDYWCVEGEYAQQTQQNSRKTKYAVAHPQLPLVLAADDNETITIWSYEQRKLIWSKTLVQLWKDVNAFSTRSSETKPRSISRPPKSKSNSTLHAQNMRIFEAFQSFQGENTTTTQVIAKNAAQSFGELKSMAFADKMTIDYDTGKPQLNNNDAVSIAELATHRLLLVFDAMIVVYDYSRNKVLFVITATNSNNNKKPTTAEFLDTNRLAVGYADGMIRVWNIARSMEELTFPANNTFKEVALLKALPIQKPGDDPSLQPIRLLVSCGDGQNQIWSLRKSSQDSFADGTDTPIAKLTFVGKLSTSVCVIDRNRDSICILSEERKATFWDLSDIANAETNALRAPQQRRPSSQQQSRRSSIFGKKSVESVEEKVPVISSTTRVKLDKAASSTVAVNKLNSLALSSHSYFPQAYLICGKTQHIAIVQDDSNSTSYASGHGVHGDDSEKQSTASAAHEKSHLLESFCEINVTSLLNDYSTANFRANVLTGDSLKVYQIQSVAVRPHVLVLSTSIGVLVLSLSHVPINNCVVFHHHWTNRRLTGAENCLRVWSTTDESLYCANGLRAGSPSDSEEAHCELRLSFVGSERRSSLGANSRSSMSVHGSGSVHGGNNSGGAGGSPFGPMVLSVSPSGRFVAVRWPESLAFAVVHVSDDLRSLTEIDRGVASEVAWVGLDDCLLICIPAHEITERASTRRFSMFGKAEKESKKWIDAVMSLKQYHSSSVRDVPISTEHLPVNNALEIVDLFSGVLLCRNASAANVLPLTASPIGYVQSDMGLKQSKLALMSSSYAQFFALQLHQDVAHFVAASPVSVPVLDVCWDYATNLCATLTANGTINVMQLTKNSLESFASIHAGASGCSLHWLRWQSSVLLHQYDRGSALHHIVKSDEISGSDSQPRLLRIESEYSSSSSILSVIHEQQ